MAKRSTDTRKRTTGNGQHGRPGAKLFCDVFEFQQGHNPTPFATVLDALAELLIDVAGNDGTIELNNETAAAA